MNDFQLMLITPDPALAQHAEECGVSRIFIDLEILGKEERQKNHNLPINNHSFKDVVNVKKAVKNAEVMVRINPPNAATPDEVSRCLDSGADCIMLPYFTRPDEVENFLKAVNGKCKTNLLLETATAVARAETILSLPVDEVHFGLNDLKLTFKLDFLYEAVSGGVIDFLCNVAERNKVSYGIGGVGSISKKSDVAPELIIKEHARLKSNRVILSRAFTGNSQNVDEIKRNMNLAEEIRLIKNVYSEALGRSDGEISQDRELFNSQVKKVAQRISSDLISKA